MKNQVNCKKMKIKPSSDVLLTTMDAWSQQISAFNVLRERNLNSVFIQTINQKWGQNKGFKVYLSCVLSEEVLKTVLQRSQRLKQERHRIQRTVDLTPKSCDRKSQVESHTACLKNQLSRLEQQERVFWKQYFQEGRTYHVMNYQAKWLDNFKNRVKAQDSFSHNFKKRGN